MRSLHLTANLLVLIALVIGALAAAAIGYFTFAIDRDAASAQRLDDLRNTSLELLIVLKSAESAERGFAITGDAKFLEPYEISAKLIPEKLAKMRDRWSDDVVPRADLAELQRRFDAKLAAMARIIADRQAGRAVGEEVRSLDDGAPNTAEKVLSDLTDRLAVDLVNRRASAQRQRSILMSLSVAALILSAALALGGFLLFHRQLAILSSERIGLLNINDELERRVSERTASLEQARAEVERERDQFRALLSDFNHRLGNNLQLVSSLIGIQSKQSNEPKVREALQAMQRRIQGLGLAQRKLRFHDSTDRSDVDALIGGIVQDLQNLLPEQPRIALDYHGAAAVLPSREAVSLGVIVNELVTNAMKYAFDDAGGTIKVRLVADGEQRPSELTVEDDGIGDKNGNDSSGSFGTSVINTLARSLDAGIEREAANPDDATRPGLRVRLRFAARAEAAE